jgi:hypothetical protein
MNLILRSCGALFLSATLLSVESLAFESPLSDRAVRDAYFLGQRNDEETVSTLNQYIRNRPVPPKGPHISEVRLFTPYAQVVDVSRKQVVGYSAQQAAQDYHARGDFILVRVRIEFTPSYHAIESDRSAKELSSEKGLSLRREDFWTAFRVGLSQKDQWIEPRDIRGEPTYFQRLFRGEPVITPNSGTSSGLPTGDMTGAFVWVEFDARDVASEPARVEVLTPDGQRVVVDFDLSSLR